MPILTHEERIGTVLGGKYRIDHILGLGGMGAVFGGVHQLTGRSVAIKLLHHEHVRNPESGHRFLREARTAAEIRHPNVVDILDVGIEPDGTVFMVLELLHGMTLAQVLEQAHHLAPAKAGDILIPVMRALVYAHRKSIVHRDLKPDNIFVSEDATLGIVPKLLDFGIAKAIDRANTRVTQTGFLLGTPSYMSPEQVTGIHENVGPQADVWSMGVVWYETLTGDAPFDGPTPTATLMNIGSGRIIHIGDVLPDLPQSLAEAIDKALVRDPARRHPSMMAFLEAVSRALGRPITVAGSTLSEFTSPGMTISSSDLKRSSIAPPVAGALSVLDVEDTGEAPLPFPLRTPARSSQPQTTSQTPSQPPAIRSSDPALDDTLAVDDHPMPPGSLDSKPWVLGNTQRDRQAAVLSMRPPLGPSDRPPFRLTGVDNTPPGESLPLVRPPPRRRGARVAAAVALVVGVVGASWVFLSEGSQRSRNGHTVQLQQQIARLVLDASAPPLAITQTADATPDAPDAPPPLSSLATPEPGDASVAGQSDAAATAQTEDPPEPPSSRHTRSRRGSQGHGHRSRHH